MQFNIPAEFKNASGVYIIRSSKSQMVYIGSTKNLYIRFKGHIGELKRGNHRTKKLNKHCAEFGIDVLEMSLLEATGIDDLLALEQHYIDLHREAGGIFNTSIKAGFYARRDGQGIVAAACNQCSKEFSYCASKPQRFCSQTCVHDSQRGVKKSAEHCEKVSKALLGKPLTERQKQSYKNRDMSFTQLPERRARISATLRGRPGKPMPSHVKQALKQANKGRKMSEEQRQAKSEQMKAISAQRPPEYYKAFHEAGANCKRPVQPEAYYNTLSKAGQDAVQQKKALAQQAVKSLYSNGKAISEICELLGISNSTVKRYISALGLRK